MDIFFHNFSWMGFNLMLAFLGMAFGWAFYYANKPIVSFIFFILWILFIPNTIYLITDLEHLYEQWGKMDFLSTILVIIQYLLLTCIGIITYIMSMYPIDKIFTKFHLKKRLYPRLFTLFFINTFIAFAIILGKFERTHSWYVFTDISRVIGDINSILNTPILILLVILFTIVINITYFAFKKVMPINITSKKY